MPGGTPSIRALFLAVALLLPGRMEGAAPRFDAGRIRSLVKLPATSFELGFAISSSEGFTLAGGTLNRDDLQGVRERIDTLRREMSSGAGRPEQHVELAENYFRLQDTNRAMAAIARAIDGFRDRLKSEPDNGWLRSQLGRALAASGSPEEGEQLMRSAIVTSPEDWRCWEALGKLLQGRAFHLLSVTDEAGRKAGMSPLTSSTPGSGIRADQRIEAVRHYEEAKRCFNRAVASGRDSPDAYTARLLFRWSGAMVLEPALYPEATPTSPTAFWASLSDVLEDLKVVARLTTNDVYAIGTAALFEAMSRGGFQAPEQMLGGGVWRELPEPSRDEIRRLTGRLETFGEHPDSTLAAGALAALGTIQFLVQNDMAAAQDTLRRATGKNPALDSAREGLLVMAFQNDRWQEFVDLCKERLKAGRSARHHYLMAKAHERLNRWPEAGAAVREAVRLAPTNTIYQLGFVALRLRVAEDPAALAEVGRTMDLLKQGRMRQAPPDEFLEFEFLHTLYFALADQREEAARHAKQLLEARPDDRTFKDLYDALGRP